MNIQPAGGCYFTTSPETEIRVARVTGGHVLAVRGRYNINNRYTEFCGLYCDEISRFSTDKYVAAQIFLDLFLKAMRQQLKLTKDIPVEFVEFRHIGGEEASEAISGTVAQTIHINFAIVENDFQAENVRLIAKRQFYKETPLKYEPTFFNNFLVKNQEESVSISITNRECKFAVVKEQASAVRSPFP